MRAIAAALAFLASLSSASGKPKIAALILQSGGVDEELANNLTEVLIARLAQRGDYEIGGKEELKTKLGVSDQAAAECMQHLGCLGRVGTELGVTRLVVGTLGRRGADYLYNLNLVDIATGGIENRVFELVAGGRVENLIAAVQTNTDRLFQPKVEPGGVRVVSETPGAMVYLDEAFVGSTPVRRDGVEPGMHGLRVEKEGHNGWAKEIEVPAGSTLEVKVPLAALPERRRWPGPLATTGAVLAGVTGAVGVVLMVLADDAPANSSVTRAEALASADRRFAEGRIGIGLLAGAGALAVTSAVVTLVYRREIFGGPARSRPVGGAGRAALGLAPTRAGALASLEVSW